MLRIAEFWRSQLVLAGVPGDILRAFIWVRMNQPEDDALSTEARIKTIDFGCVAIADGTIVADENKNDGSRGLVGEWINGVIMEVPYRGSR
jgi:hypothetical protein